MGDKAPSTKHQAAAVILVIFFKGLECARHCHIYSLEHPSKLGAVLIRVTLFGINSSNRCHHNLSALTGQRFFSHFAVSQGDPLEQLLSMWWPCDPGCFTLWHLQHNTCSPNCCTGKEFLTLAVKLFWPECDSYFCCSQCIGQNFSHGSASLQSKLGEHNSLRCLRGEENWLWQNTANLYWGAVIVPILQIWKLKFREDESVV